MGNRVICQSVDDCTASGDRGECVLSELHMGPASCDFEQVVEGDGTLVNCD